MRIAIDGQLIGRPGGVGGYVSSLIRALTEYDGAHHYFLYTTCRAPIPEAVACSRLTVRRCALTHYRAFRALWQQRRLPVLLERDHVDLLHSPSYVVPLKAKTPVVLGLHDVIALKHPELCSRLNALHYRHHLPRAIRHATAVVASSETTRRDILETCDVEADKIRVIYPGIDRVFRPCDEPARRRQVRAKLHLPQRFVLFLGNIEPKKGLDTLLRAYAEVAGRRSGYALVIAGAPLRGLRKLLALTVGLGIKDKVLFTGPVSREDLPGLYSMADLFVFPSRYEGFGLPPLEAMACGTPVVCSDGGALPEVTGGAALVFPVGDHAALAEKMVRVLSDPELGQRMVEAGKQRATLLEWSSSVRRLLQLYAAAVRER